MTYLCTVILATVEVDILSLARFSLGFTSAEEFCDCWDALPFPSCFVVYKLFCDAAGCKQERYERYRAN